MIPRSELDDLVDTVRFLDTAQSHLIGGGDVTICAMTTHSGLTVTGTVSRIADNLGTLDAARALAKGRAYGELERLETYRRRENERQKPTHGLSDDEVRRVIEWARNPDTLRPVIEIASPSDEEVKARIEELCARVVAQEGSAVPQAPEEAPEKNSRPLRADARDGAVLCLFLGGLS